MTDQDQSREAFYAWLHTYEEEVGALDDPSAKAGFTAGWQAALNHKAAVAPTTEDSSGVAPAVPPMTFINKDFYWDSAKQHHVPTLYIEFTPVPANSPNDAPGWVDRDRLAAMLAAAPQPPKEQT